MSDPRREPLRVMVVDDHAVVRKGLRLLLQAAADDLIVTDEAADGAQAVAAVAAAPPDVVLMDLSMPHMGGVEATRRIKASAPDIHVVVLTSMGDRDLILAALDAGADGYLFKHADPDEIVAAVRAAADGGAVLDPKAARALLDRARAEQQQPTLSERETQVLRLVAEGLSNRMIARRLAIKERTVKAHLTRVYQTLGVSDRTQAALWARDHLPPSTA